ncbi:SoxR reducing system RseC family protein [candidate division KSB1 bacterium]|nr:SoxR reducing system RseC family protein [candidate division KSB1 bacterium]MBL7092864.1 SoxR reducing system RseC family protein [candidate division KSB1 bacterium]
MTESGVINKIIDDKAWVTVIKGEHCQGCTACSAFGEGSAELIARNETTAKVGDRVEVEIDPQKVVKHSAIVFLLPVFGLVLGYFLGVNYLTKLALPTEGAGILGSLGMMVLTFIGIVFYDRKIGKSGEVHARVVRVL